MKENEARKLANDLENTRLFVFSVCQQTILSLAHKFHMAPKEAFACLSGYFKSFGADYVLDTRVADDLALLESRTEFVERFKSDTPCFPMISSSCPGWVCYAEKTHGNFILPYISTTRSPQQIMGVLVKQLLAQKLGVAADKIYHCAVMPCYDKKLEASREDFFSEALQSRDVDCVITSSKMK